MRLTRRLGVLVQVALMASAAAACGDEPGPYAGPCVVERDDGVDGVVDRRTTTTYEGRLPVRVEFDDDGDGTIDGVWLYEYADGVLRREVDGDAPDGANGIEYLYDESGFLVQLGYDDDGDAQGDRGHTYTNDATGNILIHELYDDYTAAPSWRDTHTYDAEGYLLRIDHDRGADDAVDDVITYTWSAEHTDLRVQEDRGLDDVIDDIRHHTFDRDGNLLLEEVDWDGDGVWDRRDEHTYVEGRLTRTETDEGADGVLDAVQIYQYDGQGRRTLAAYYDGAQSPFSRIYTTYTSRGNPLQDETRDGAGEVLSRTTYDYGCWK